MKYKNKPMLSCAKLCTTFGSYRLSGVGASVWCWLIMIMWMWIDN